MTATTRWWSGSTGPDPGDGQGCDETYEPEVRVDERNVVVIMVKAMHPRADPSCAQVPREVSVELGAPRRPGGPRAVDQPPLPAHRRDVRAGARVHVLWARRLLHPVADARPRPVTPRPTARRSTPSTAASGWAPTSAATGRSWCWASTSGPVVAHRSSRPRPPPCRRDRTAYFVANDGAWRLVAYGGEDETCDYVAEDLLIRFPAALCS